MVIYAEHRMYRCNCPDKAHESLVLRMYTYITILLFRSMLCNIYFCRTYQLRFWFIRCLLYILKIRLALLKIVVYFRWTGEVLIIKKFGFVFYTIYYENIIQNLLFCVSWMVFLIIINTIFFFHIFHQFIFSFYVSTKFIIQINLKSTLIDKKRKCV